MVCEENPTESRRSTRLTRSLAAVDPTTVFPSHASTNFPASQSHNIKSSLLVGTFSGSFPFDVNNHRLQMALYRPAAPVPEHIREHCTIYLDEQLYTSAISLLSDLITNGQGSPERETRPVYSPPPFHIELVACLLVHPRYTNQAPPEEQAQLTSQAISFLRNTLAILGPVNANLKDALSLTYDETRLARRRAYIDSQHDQSGSDSDEKPEHIKGVIANKGRLRSCAKDFWHIVGWAFNCSIMYPKRWKYWKVWLAYMIDVLDDDWVERARLDEKFETRKKEGDPDTQLKQEMNSGSMPRSRLQECLLLEYLAGHGRSSPLARIIRSIFADASPRNLSDFPEVFSGETKDIKHTGQKRKRGNKFGDYNDEDEEAGGATEIIDQPSDATDMQEEDSVGDFDPYLGGAEVMALRQKLVKLLSRAAHYRSADFVDTYDLYEAVYIGMKELPVPAFSLFTAPPFANKLPLEAYVSVAMLYLLRLLPNNAPPPYKVQSKAADEISDIVLEKCYLPFAASTSSVADNARVSIQVENLLRMFLKACDWEHSARFVAAIEKGIVARENKVKPRRSKESGEKQIAEQDDLLWLRASGERLRALGRLMAAKQRSH